MKSQFKELLPYHTSGGKKYVTSLTLAKILQREHFIVLRDIRKYRDKFLSLGYSLDEIENLFFETTYTDLIEREIPMFNLTVEGAYFMIVKSQSETSLELVMELLSLKNKEALH